MKQILAVVLAVTVIGWSGLASGAAGPEDFTARIVPAVAEAVNGAQVQMRIEFDFKNYENQGFSIGVCTADESVAKGASYVWGPGVMTAKCGTEPAQFKRLNIIAGGITMGVVVDFDAVCKIPPTMAFHAATVTYDVLGEPGQCTDLVICDTLGTPAVQTVVVVEGVSIKPATLENAKICVKEAPAKVVTLDLVAADGEVSADKMDEEEVTVKATNGGVALALQGWSYGVSHDAAYLELVEIKGSPLALATNGGAGPDFYALDIAPVPGPGGTVGCVISLEPPFEDIPLPEGETIDLETFVYRSVEKLDCDVRQTTDLAFSDQLGTPAVDNVLVVEGLSLAPAAMEGETIALVGPCIITATFVRGDSNTDRKIDIADGIFILNELFQPKYGNVSKCKDATDANADGQIDATDAIYVIYYQLLDGPQPPAPFPTCGTVEVVLGCDEYPCP